MNKLITFIKGNVGNILLVTPFALSWCISEYSLHKADIKNNELKDSLTKVVSRNDSLTSEIKLRDLKFKSLNDSLTKKVYEYQMDRTELLGLIRYTAGVNFKNDPKTALDIIFLVDSVEAGGGLFKPYRLK